MHATNEDISQGYAIVIAGTQAQGVGKEHKRDPFRH